MLDLRGVHLPTPAEISAERMRRSASVDGLPADWESFEVCGRWMRLEELDAIVEASTEVALRGENPGLVVVNLDETLGGRMLVFTKEDGTPRGKVSGPLVERVHRRASVRYLLGLRRESHGALPLPVAECIGALQRRDGLGYKQRTADAGCRCLVAAVERAEVVEVDLQRAALLAERLAKCAHRATRRERRRATRKAKSSPTRARAGSEVFERRVEPIRERPLRELEEVPAPPSSRSLSAARLGRFPLSEQAFLDEMRARGFEITTNDRPSIGRGGV